ncbi:TPA: HIT family hydrolase [Candidatus Dependentiae bacterium]|nr:MAG: Histidine triad (HIT) protein [candidate division TM6 bacterium GW2011_GWF2_43_87]HBL98274.1 HIT family hydrolase [Candidatus Dependentiae bacterium]
MEYLYAPWRGTYAEKIQKKEKSSDGKSVFTAQFETTDDEKCLILRRFENSIVLLNLYPYNPGHLLIVPKQPAANLYELTPQTRCEMMEIASASERILYTVLKCNGINIGFNLGDHSSGGSIPEHLHLHVIPRWRGDTGFLPLIAETKLLSEDLRIVYNLLKEPFSKLILGTHG